MYKSIILPTVCSMDYRENKVEERHIKQASQEEVNSLKCYHWKETKEANF